MIYNIAYIVGDEFRNFASNENVLTFSDFVENLYKKRNKKLFDYVVIGQGLNEVEKKIIAFMSSRESMALLNEEDVFFANSDITHKHKAENILISNPIKRNNEVYFAKLLIDDACAEMSDHVTGQHIQGMVLTEAARQMMLSVAEKYILDPADQGTSYCVLLRVCSTFHQFNFPIETTIKHSILDLKRKKSRYISKTKTEICQNNEVISLVEIDYIFSNKESLLSREGELAKFSLEKNIKLKTEELSLPLTA